MTLFRELIGPGFAALPPPVRRVHEDRATTLLAGRGRVERGTGWLSMLFAIATSLPAAGEDVPVRVAITRDATGGETWSREFGGHAMVSRLRARGGLLEERLGAATFRFRLVADGGRIDWRLVAVRALGIPVPLAFFSGVRAAESIDGERYRFDVEARLPVVGLLVRYGGTLAPAAD
jgi:hypothetical protein